MADKRKMSVAEMIAAARKADGGGGSASAESASPAEQEETPPTPVAEKPASEAPAAKPKPAKSAGGGRLSVAEMLAAARAQGGGDAAAAPAPAAPAEKKAAPSKPDAKPVIEKVEAAPADRAVTSERDTASILAAARKSSKAGPMSKAEAAAKEKADPIAKEKPKVYVPPMPEKPAYALPRPVVKVKADAREEIDESRRGFLSLGFWMLGLVSALWTLASIKFMFPNVRREPPSKFKVGFPDAYAAGQVQEKFKAQYGVWVVNAEYNGQQQIYALKTVCTHLGCTPNWLDAEQKFKCPCHGSGFYKDGINFEGPAPRPLERYAIRVADDGQIEIDKSRTFQQEMGQWEDPSSFIQV